MYAIIKTGGKQYKVKKGDKIDVELLAVEIGKNVEFNEVLLVNNGSDTQIGEPSVKGAVVVGTLVDSVRGPKIQSMKFRKRKKSRRKFGHRQDLSRVEITDIIGSTSKAKEAKHGT